MDFEDLSSARDWADSWVAAHTPNLIRDEIAAFEADHRERFLQSYGRAVDQFYVQYGALAQAVDALNFVDRTHWPSHRPIQYVIVAKNLNGFHSTMDRLSKGFVVDSMSIVRGLYDAFLGIIHVSLNSTDPLGAIMARPPSPTPRFNATGIVKGQLRLDWMSNYAIMSVFAHGNLMEVAQSINRMHDRSLPRERLGLTFEPDVLVVETVLPFLSLVTLLYLRFVPESLGATSDVEDAPLIATCRDAVALLTFAMRDNSKPRWRKIADDIDYLFNVFSAADAGGDWKSLRDARPPVTTDEPKS